MRIALDLGGGPIQPALAGALEAARKGGLELRLFGPEEALRSELAMLGASENQGLSIHDAPGVIGPDEDPQTACRDNVDASVLLAAACAASGEADAFVTVAPVRVAAAAGLWHCKRLPGVLRPAAASLLPVSGGPALLLDTGAATDCKPWHLLQFALMGSLYARCVMDRRDPVVRVLGSGTRGSGPGELVREALPLLKYAGVRFEGPINSESLAAGGFDVVVADGDCGEAVLGALWGFAKLHSLMLESSVVKSPFRKLGAALARGVFEDSAAFGRAIGGGGTALLGIGGTGVVCRATRDGAAEAVESAVRLSNSEFRDRVQRRLEDVKTGMQDERA